MTVEAESNAHMLSQASKRSPHNILLQRKPEEAKAERRQVFLRKVRQASDDKRWESRSDEILRREFLSRKKTWEEAQVVAAPKVPSSLEDEGESAPWSNTTANEHFEDLSQLGSRSSMTEAEIADEIMMQEDQEFEALVSMLQESNPAAKDQGNVATAYGSDEEDYDQLFMEVMAKEYSTAGDPGGTEGKLTNQDQDMDMSSG